MALLEELCQWEWALETRSLFCFQLADLMQAPSYCSRVMPAVMCGIGGHGLML